jgi:hypothetical protein
VKTISLKKVSAVAVAALAFGGLTSVAPANAAAVTVFTKYESNVTKVSLSKATTTPTTGAAVFVNVGATTLTAGTASGSTITGAITQLRGVLSSYPAGGFVPVSSSVNVAGAATGVPTVPAGSDVVIANTNNTGASGVNSIFIRDIEDAAVLAAYDVATTSTTGLASMSFTPAKAGTYVLTVWNDGPAIGATTIGNNTVDSNEAVQTISITVVAATGLSTSASIVRMGSLALAIAQNNVATNLTNYSTTVDAVPRSGGKGTSAAPVNIGQVAVVLINADGSAAGNLHTVTADITGSGLVLCNNTAAETAGTVRSSVLTLTGTNNVAVCHISSDGTAGPGTVTISVTDSVSETKTVLGTETFTSFGTVAKLEVSTKNYTIGRAGFTSGVSATARVAATTVGNAAAAATVTSTSGTSTTPAFIVKATDSLGQAVSTTLAPAIVSGTTTVVTGGTCLLDDGVVATISSSTNGVGFYNCDFATSAAAASGAKSTLTIRVVDPAGDGTTFLTTTLDVTVGGSVSSSYSD